jgi:hypothetical protein
MRKVQTIAVLFLRPAIDGGVNLKGKVWRFR